MNVLIWILAILGCGLAMNSADRLHNPGRALSAYLRSLLVNETNARLLEQYTAKYMEPQKIQMEAELNHVTSLLSRHLLMLSSTVDDFKATSVSDNFYGYAFTAMLNYYFGADFGFAITICSDNNNVYDVVTKNVPRSQWNISKPSLGVVNSSLLCKNGLLNSAASGYHLVVHVCTTAQCFFDLPTIQNCSTSSSLLEFVVIKTESSLLNGTCSTEKLVNSATPCMISRYICLSQDANMLLKSQMVRNEFAAAIFNSTALQEWAVSSTNVRRREKVPAAARLRQQLNIVKDCSANPNLMLMSRSFATGHTHRFVAVATAFCRPDSPKQLIDTSSIGLLLKYRLHFSPWTYAFLIDIDAKTIIYHPSFDFIQSVPFEDLNLPSFNDAFLAGFFKFHARDLVTLRDGDSDRNFIYSDGNLECNVYAHKFSTTANWAVVFIVKKAEQFMRLLPKANVIFPKDDHSVQPAKFHGAFARRDYSPAKSFSNASPCALFRYNVSYGSFSVPSILYRQRLVLLVIM